MTNALGGPGVACSAMRIRRLAAGELAGEERARTEEHLAALRPLPGASSASSRRSGPGSPPTCPFEVLAAGVAERLARAPRRGRGPGARLADGRRPRRGRPPRDRRPAGRSASRRTTTGRADEGRRRADRLGRGSAAGARARAGRAGPGGRLAPRRALAGGARRSRRSRSSTRTARSILHAGPAQAGVAPRRVRVDRGGEGTLVAVLDDAPIDAAALAEPARPGRAGRGGAGRPGRGRRPPAPEDHAVRGARVALARRRAPRRAAPRRRCGCRRFALVAGEPDGGGGHGAAAVRRARRPPHPRDPDARRRGQRATTRACCSRPGAGAFRRALAELSQASAAARARGERTLLVVYYSGHAKDDALRLGAGRIPLDELRGRARARARGRADRAARLLPLGRDRAREGGAPGARVRREDRRGRRARRGLVLIASSAADEDSQESDAIGASWFTHHLASGLLGGADASGDGRVTLARGVRLRLRADGRVHRVERGRRAAPGLPLRPGRRGRRRPRRARPGRGRPRLPGRRGGAVRRARPRRAGGRGGREGPPAGSGGSRSRTGATP